MSLTTADLKKRIADILKDADLETTSAKKVRTQLEEDTGSDLSSRKEEIGRIIQEVMDETADDESGDEDPEDEEDEPEEESEEEYAPKKNGAAKAKVRYVHMCEIVNQFIIMYAGLIEVFERYMQFAVDIL